MPRVSVSSLTEASIDVADLLGLGFNTVTGEYVGSAAVSVLERSEGRLDSQVASFHLIKSSLKLRELIGAVPGPHSPAEPTPRAHSFSDTVRSTVAPPMFYLRSE